MIDQDLANTNPMIFFWCRVRVETLSHSQALADCQKWGGVTSGFHMDSLKFNSAARLIGADPGIYWSGDGSITVDALGRRWCPAIDFKFTGVSELDDNTTSSELSELLQAQVYSSDTRFALCDETRLNFICLRCATLFNDDASTLWVDHDTSQSTTGSRWASEIVRIMQATGIQPDITASAVLHDATSNAFNALVLKHSPIFSAAAASKASAALLLLGMDPDKGKWPGNEYILPIYSADRQSTFQDILTVIRNELLPLPDSPRLRRALEIQATAITAGCPVCLPGSYPDNANTSKCVACPPGTFSNGSTINCSWCPSGYSSPGGAASCFACSAGWYRPFTDVQENGTCLQCPNGWASLLPGSKRCLPCPAGTYPAFGRTACSACQAGQEWNLTIAACTNCTPGHYSAPAGTGLIFVHASCTECPAGKFAPAVGAARCNKCSTGHYANAASTECAPCPAGFAASKSGTSFCYQCSAGTFSATTASSFCIECIAGKYSVLNSTTCFTCPPGTRGVKSSASGALEIA